MMDSRRSSDTTANADDVESYHLSDVPETASQQEAISRVLTCSTTASCRLGIETPAEKLTLGANKPLPSSVGSSDLYAVEFDGPNDPTHPQNWSTSRKLATSVILGFSTLTVTFGSAEYAAAANQIMDDFDVSLVPCMLGISLFVAGFAAGPVLWGSLSEYYGRKFPLTISAFSFMCFSFMGATAKDFQTLLICRFLSGFMGSAPLAVVPGVFSDIISPEYRGTALSMFINLVMAGPTIAPIAGAYITYSHLGWRWTGYISGIMGALSTTLIIFFVEESYYACVLVHKARNLRRQTGNWAIHAVAEKFEIDFGPLLWLSIKRPIKLIFTQPIVLLTGIYGAFAYGILYLALTGFPLIYQGRYHMSYTISQLPYIGMFIGMGIGSGYLCAFEYRFRKILAAGKKIPTEARLHPMIIPGFTFPLGIFLLFWAGYHGPQIHWIAPVIGGGIIGFSLIGIFLCLTTYTVESYLAVAASVTAALAFMRAAFAAATPLFTRAMFDGMGIQWAGTLLGCCAAVLAPIPVLFVLFADKLNRTKQNRP